jgi:hypothetical protein
VGCVDDQKWGVAEQENRDDHQGWVQRLHSSTPRIFASSIDITNTNYPQIDADCRGFSAGAPRFARQDRAGERGDKRPIECASRLSPRSTARSRPKAAPALGEWNVVRCGESGQNPRSSAFIRG